MTVLVGLAKALLRISTAPFIVLMVLTGALLLLVRPRWGRRWVIGFAIVFWFVSTPLGSGLLAIPLARGYVPIENGRGADSARAIVVLGGGTHEVSAGPVKFGRPSNETALRVAEGVRIFRLLDGQPLVVASGGLSRVDQTIPEGDVIAATLEALEVPRDRILIDRSSRTTREQAIAVTALLRSQGIERFVLVTSPTHMWRAVLVFRAEGSDVIPSPAPLGASRMTEGHFLLPSNDSLQLSDDTMYDYASTAYYWARGWFRLEPPVLTR